MKIEVMDTTLRDGEQTSGVSFSEQEKLSIARFLLDEVGVDRLEIASARVSDGEYEAVKRIAKWAKQNGHLHKLEVLGFVDGDVSLKWIKEAGCEVINLLTKGSELHARYQLKKTLEEHVADIKAVLATAEKMGISVNVYLEDWSNGMKSSKTYVFAMMDALRNEKVDRFMLPDTLGVLSPEQTFTFCSEIRERYPELHLDFHPHNDYDLAIANIYYAVKAGFNGIHTTVNGLGERAGNAPLSSVIAVLHDQLGLETSVDESKITQVSRMVETYSGIHISTNKPVIGENVFTQCAGIHADGDSKNNLYYNDLLPERFGRTREYALGKMSGKANIKKNLENLGIDLDEASMKKVTDRIIQLGDKKEMVTPEDLPYIISDVLGYDQSKQRIKLLNYSLSIAQGLKPAATLKIEIEGQAYQETASGDGQYDAFMRALRKIYDERQKPLPMLTNYSVSIPPGGRTDAFVQTIISWRYMDIDFKTRGLEADQTEAAIVATLKMLNKIEEM